MNTTRSRSPEIDAFLAALPAGVGMCSEGSGDDRGRRTGCGRGHRLRRAGVPLPGTSARVVRVGQGPLRVLCAEPGGDGGAPRGAGGLRHRQGTIRFAPGGRSPTGARHPARPGARRRDGRGRAMSPAARGRGGPREAAPTGSRSPRSRARSRSAARTSSRSGSATVVDRLWCAASASGSRPSLRAPVRRPAPAAAAGPRPRARRALRPPLRRSRVRVPYWALRDVPAGVAAVVLAVGPLLTLLLAVAHGMERLSGRALGGAVVALAGSAVIFAEPGGDGFGWRSFALLGLAALCASESVAVSKLAGRQHPVAMNFVGMSVGEAVLLLVSWAAGDRSRCRTRRHQLALAYLVAATVGPVPAGALRRPALDRVGDVVPVRPHARRRDRAGRAAPGRGDHGGDGRRRRGRLRRGLRRRRAPSLIELLRAMPEIGSRWEWRVAGEPAEAAARRVADLAAESPRESDELYVLAERRGLRQDPRRPLRRQAPRPRERRGAPAVAPGAQGRVPALGSRHRTLLGALRITGVTPEPVVRSTIPRPARAARATTCGRSRCTSGGGASWWVNAWPR